MMVCGGFLMKNNPKLGVSNIRVNIGIDDKPQIILEWDGWMNRDQLKWILRTMDTIDFCNISLSTGHPIFAIITSDGVLSAKIEGYCGKDSLGYYLDYIATSVPTGRKCFLRSKPIFRAYYE